MKKSTIILLILSLNCIILKAQVMETNKTTLRLLYPQWQGGIVSSWMPDIDPEDSSRGYYLGAQLLNFLAPKNGQKEVEVPISLDINDRATENGISSYQVILKQTKDALNLLEQNNPDRIVTLGGECSVSVVPFTYLASKYPNDVAIIWLDAHPDVNLPYDNYEGYHAMALTACLGIGDSTIMNVLPTKIDASRALIVGLRDWDEGMKERQERLGIKSLSPDQITNNSESILDWLKETGATKVVIHFDMDVLDPNDVFAAVAPIPNGIKIDEVVRIINDINTKYDIVGLTIAEPMPRVAIKLKKMLDQLPLLK